MLEITDLKYASSNMPVIKVIGVGGCGNNAVNRLSHETPFPIQFIAINTDQMVLDKSNADICLTIGKKLTNGFVQEEILRLHMPLPKKVPMKSRNL